MPTANYPSMEHLKRMILAKMISRTGVTDVGQLSFLNSLSSAVARAIDQVSLASKSQRDSWNIATCYGTDLDARAQDFLPQGEERLPAYPATGQVAFTRSNARAGSAEPITQGFVVSDANGNNFGTTQAASMPPVADTTVAGNQTVTVPVAALIGGSAGNVAAGTVTVFQSDRPTSIDSVTNPTAMTGGADAESDPAFRQRIYAYSASLARSTAPAIINALLGQQDSNGNAITSCSVVTDPSTPGICTVYVDNGSGTLSVQTAQATNENLCTGLTGPSVTWNGTTYQSATGVEQYFTLANWPVDFNAQVTLTSNLRGNLVFDSDYYLNQTNGQIHLVAPLSSGEVLLANYTYYTGIVAIAQRIVTGDPTNYANYPGVAGAGIQAIVAVPQIVYPPISINVVVASGYTQATINAAVSTAILSLVSSLGVGDPLYVAAIIQATMNTTGVEDCSLISPATDVLVGPQTVIRAETVTVL